MEGTKDCTIEDIAKALGVSKTTVSRAMSGKGRIGKETVRRVQEYAEAHGYRPNTIARGLAQRKTYNIGLVLPADFSITDAAFFRECIAGICEMATANNYDVVLSMAEGGDFSQICRQIENRKVDGIIISRSTEDMPLQKLLMEKNIPFILVGPCSRSKVLWVDNQNYEASKELTKIMLMKGYRKLALLGGDRKHYVTESRRTGYEDAHRELNLTVDKGMEYMEVDSYLKTARTVDWIVERGIEGIICMDDHICSLVLGCLRERGIRIPADIKVASFYDSTQMENNVPPITSLRFDTRALGQYACMRLLREMGEEPVWGEEISLSYQVVLRKSTS